MLPVFLRFACTRIDKDSRRPEGVFAASYSLLESGTLNSDEYRRLREFLDWFNGHLPHPPKKFVASRAVFWFKSTATENISRVWELVQFLQDHSHVVEVHKCRRLANILYEDDFQVAAYPSKRDSTIRVR
jgi:hypothetical protein